MISAQTRRNELTRRRLSPDRHKPNHTTSARWIPSGRLCVYRKIFYFGGTIQTSSPTIFNRTSIVRIPYVKYSTGANETARTAHRALGKPNRTAARRAFLTGSAIGEWQAEAKCFSARQRYFASQRPFLPYLFPQEGKDMARGAAVTARRISSRLRRIRPPEISSPYAFVSTSTISPT